MLLSYMSLVMHMSEQLSTLVVVQIMLANDADIIYTLLSYMSPVTHMYKQLPTLVVVQVTLANDVDICERRLRGKGPGTPLYAWQQPRGHHTARLRRRRCRGCSAHICPPSPA